MAIYPEHSDLLRALASFLREDVRPALSADDQRGLRYRALVAAHLADRMAEELAADEQLDADEARALAAVVGPDAESPSGGDVSSGTSRADRRAAIARQRVRLAGEIRDGLLSGPRRAAIREHLLRSMGARLAVQSPGFSLARDIE